MLYTTYCVVVDESDRTGTGDGRAGSGGMEKKLGLLAPATRSAFWSTTISPDCTPVLSIEFHPRTTLSSETPSLGWSKKAVAEGELEYTFH